MAVTRRQDIIIPEVLSAMISAQIPGQLALAGTDRVVVLDNLEGKPGDKVKIPKWGAVGEFELATEGQAITPVNLTASSKTVEIKKYSKAVDITQEALLSAYSDPIKELGTQFARYAALALDKALIAEAETTTLSHTVSSTISLNAILDAKALFRDAQDDVVLVLHDKVATDLMKLNEFKTLTQISSEVLVKGAIGTIYGMPVVVSRFITKTPGTPDTYTNLLVKREALGLWYKRQFEVEKDVDILRDVITVRANTIFAVGLFEYDPLPVVKLITQ